MVLGLRRSVSLRLGVSLFAALALLIPAVLRAQTESVLASFSGTTGAAPGANPYYGNLIQASDGNFYGMTYQGGASDDGAAFKMTPAGVVTLLHSFAGAADGQYPNGSLVQGMDGNFYGMTENGGASNDGVAFKMTAAGTVTLLHSFGGGSDGQFPFGSLVQGTDGNFYGLTGNGGAYGDGAAFKMTPAGAVTLLHSFGATGTDGQNPQGSLVQGTDGNFYGLTEYGGANGDGAVFQMTSAGAVTLLYSFGATGTDGQNPYGSLVQGTDGNFYGMTNGGGSSSIGILFKQTTGSTLAAPVSLSSTATTVYTGGAFTLTYSVANAYTGSTNGTNAGSGSLGYCFASNSASNATWTGVIVGKPTAASSPSLTAPSTPGTYTYSLTCGGMESNLVTLTVTTAPPTVTGVSPTNGTVSGGTSVTITGTNFTGATAVKFGAVNATSFTVNSATQITAVSPAGAAGAVNVTVTTPGGTSATSSADQFTYLRGSVTFGVMSFSPASSETVGTSQAITISEAITYGGAQPTGAVTFVLNGVTYTATCTTAGSPETCTATVPAATIAALPAAGYTVTAALAQDSAYNAGSGTSGTFTITPPYFVLASFTVTAGAAPGGYPVYGNLIQASDGNFYGLTQQGGANGDGAAFKMTSGGAVTLLHSFGATGTDGQYPNGGLVQGTDGNFYGMTSQGGANDYGAAFKMTPTGAVTLLHSFGATGTDGQDPLDSLVQGTDGNFYGLTRAGGANGYGAAFQMTPAGAVTLLHSFGGGSDGQYPFGSLVQGTDGNFYGLTQQGGANGYGAAFKMTSGGAVTLLHSFAGSADGENPRGSLVQGTDGNFYGLTEYGGASGDGAAFQMTPAGAVTLLHSFAGTADGSNPFGSLVQGTDGNFYGLTFQGGANNYGTAFQMTPAGAVTLLHSFAGGSADGAYPYGSMVQGTDGNFYGMTNKGGANGYGVIFKQTTATALAAPVALSSTSTTVYTGGAFTLTYSVANAYTGSTNGTNTGSSSLGYCFASNTASNTTWTGVIAGSPTVASSPSLTAPSTAGTYTYSLTCGGMESNLVTITVTIPPAPTVTGVAPTSGTTAGGTSVTITGTNFTGATAVKFGTTNATSYTVTSATQITAVSPAGAAGAVDVTVTTTGGTSATGSADQFTYLRGSVTFGAMSFSPASSETVGTSQAISISEAIAYGGAQPTGAVTFVLNGVTYTATCTTAGSPETCTATVPAATIAALPVAGYTVTAALAQDSAYNAGSGTSGTFTITPPNFVLVNFTGNGGAATGGFPQYGNLIQASDGNFYGLTDGGGASGVGTVFKITPSGTYTLLYSFGGYPLDGANPYGSLVQGTDGNFYGLTSHGANTNGGIAFKITPSGTYTVLHTFDTYDDGFSYFPYGSLVQGTDGNFYGMTQQGGQGANCNGYCGTVFKMTPSGTVTVLHFFASSTTDGADPVGSLVQGTDGNFYGMTNGGGNGGGTVFKMTAAGTVTLLHNFSGTGEEPYGSLVQGTDGNFYGLTSQDSASDDGTAFKITPSGTYTVLHTFAGAADGANPYGSLVQGTDGNFYGMTPFGGANNDGVTFKMTPAGTVTLLYSFAGGTGGGFPYGSLVQGTDGNFYGMTYDGGYAGGSPYDGTVFKQTTGSTLAAPVALSSTATTVVTGGTFTLTYSVYNAYTGATNGTTTGSGTLGYCFASNTAGDTTWTGVITGSPTAATSPTLTAPATPGTYTYSLTCGGMESNLVMLPVLPPPPTVAGVSPTNGTVSGGTSVTIIGNHFTGATAVKFGAANATSFTVNSDAQITAVAPAGSAGAVDVTVTTAGGTSATSSADQFTYLRASVTFGTMSFSPAATEPQGMSQAITISDSVTYGGAQPTGAVTFVLNGVTYTATCTTAGSPETCSATVPAATVAALPGNSYTVTAALASDSTYNAATGTSGTFTITASSFGSLTVTGYASPAVITEVGTVTVTANYANGNVDPLFTGTVTLTSSDAHATLPSSYTFTSTDAGVHIFNVTLNSLGTESITATTSGSVTASQTGILVGDAIWVLNAAGTLDKLSRTGSLLTSGVGTSGTAASYGGTAFDNSGNVWSVTAAANSVLFTSKLATGTATKTGAGLNAPVAVAVDGAGYVWVANQSGNTVSEFTNAGAAQSSSSGYGSNYVSGEALSAPSAIAIDQTGGVWVTNKTGNTVTHIFGAATPVMTPLSTATTNGTLGSKP